MSYHCYKVKEIIGHVKRTKDVKPWIGHRCKYWREQTNSTTESTGLSDSDLYEEKRKKKNYYHHKNDTEWNRKIVQRPYS